MSFTSLVSKAIGAYNGMTLGNITESTETNQAIITQVKDIEWGYQSLFHIEAMNMNNTMPSPENSMHMFRDNLILNTLNASILNVETATITHSPIEEWIGGHWVYTTGRPELRQITFTFRETASAWLYRNFNTAYNANRNAFPDNQKWDIRVYMHGATPAEKDMSTVGRFGDSVSPGAMKNKGTLIQTSKAILDSISAVSLDQGATDSFVTFSVTFKYMNEKHNFDTKLTDKIQKAINSLI